MIDALSLFPMTEPPSRMTAPPDEVVYTPPPPMLCRITPLELSPLVVMPPVFVKLIAPELLSPKPELPTVTDVGALPTRPPPPPMDWMVKPGELTPEVLMGASLSAEISDPLTSVPSADALPTSTEPSTAPTRPPPPPILCSTVPGLSSP